MTREELIETVWGWVVHRAPELPRLKSEAVVVIGQRLDSLLSTVRREALEEAARVAPSAELAALRKVEEAARLALALIYDHDAGCDVIYDRLNLCNCTMGNLNTALAELDRVRGEERGSR